MLDNTERCGIAADHREMCRFVSSEDQGFRTVVEALRRYARRAPEVVAERCRRARELLADETEWHMAEMRNQSVSGGQLKVPLLEQVPSMSQQQEIISEDIVVEAERRPRSLVIKPQWQGE